MIHHPSSTLTKSINARGGGLQPPCQSFARRGGCNPPPRRRRQSHEFANANNGGGQNARATGGPGILPETRAAHFSFASAVTDRRYNRSSLPDNY
jgi:hypothetical protein